jgi:hypothetical protein
MPEIAAETDAHHRNRLIVRMLYRYLRHDEELWKELAVPGDHGGFLACLGEVDGHGGI